MCKLCVVWLTYLSHFIISVCIPNTKPAGQEVKARVFLVLGVMWVGALPAVTLTVLNLMIVCRLCMMKRPGNNSLREQNEMITKTDGKTKVTFEVSLK